MQPAVIEGWQHAPGAPKGWNPELHGHCGALPIRVDFQQGLQFMRSAWEPTPGEVAAIVAGSRVELGIQGSVHPVVNLGVGPVPQDTPADRLAFVVTREVDDSGAVWCRVLAIIGPHRFPAGIEIANPSKPQFQELAFEDAASRLISAVQTHAREQGWIA